MFYQMITNARNCWLTSDNCTVKDLVAYIESTSQMRDAQIDAIKTYLFLKIGCDCKPLSRLFSEGYFNTLDLQTVELAAAPKAYLEEHPEAVALLEYARLKNDTGEQVSQKLEELVYPLVSQIVQEYDLTADCILKFHKGNKQYPQPADSQMQFDTLDNPISKIRIVLLVQIGKEGWDCRSLTGIILSQEGDCPKNMVLQTSCRCLRQVDRGQPETALIYLKSRALI